jgi:hypothetical protein
MIDYTNATIDAVSVHHVGNKSNGEDLLISKNSLDTSDTLLRELLMRFFLPPFTSGEFYSFTFSNEDFRLNPLYQFATQVFSNKQDLHFNSIHIAKHLYEVSGHPQIKSGDLFVAHFSNISTGDESVNVIGIFKSETRQPFLKLNVAQGDFSLNYEDGINIEKLDKGCLIFNTEKSNGYKICIVDKLNKSTEAQFWKDNFLMLRPCNDDYHQTKDFLTITKNYATKQLPEDFEVGKTDQIDILNRSLDYFKTHDSFDKEEFEQVVFQKPDMIQSFRKFDASYREENNVEVEGNFDISVQAVKKQSRIFKSVLKLDKNFHIYIHGNREMIEQGVDPNGRKFYKIYYQQEE